MSVSKQQKFYNQILLEIFNRLDTVTLDADNGEHTYL